MVGRAELDERRARVAELEQQARGAPPLVAGPERVRRGMPAAGRADGAPALHATHRRLACIPLHASFASSCVLHPKPTPFLPFLLFCRPQVAELTMQAEYQLKLKDLATQAGAGGGALARPSLRVCVHA
jgi:hypothetical protein